MKNKLRLFLSACAMPLCLQAFSQIDTAHRYNPNAEANPGKVLHDTVRVWPNGPDNRSPVHMLPDTARKQLPRKMETPGRLVQPADTMRNKNPLRE